MESQLDDSSGNIKQFSFTLSRKMGKDGGDELSYYYKFSDFETCLATMCSEFRAKEEFFDVTVRVGKLSFKAHKIILAANSLYFRSMFRTNLSESDGIVELHEISEDAVGLLIDFFYSGVICLTFDNVQNVLVAASMLQVLPLMQACCNFMSTVIEPSNALGIQAFADLHSCQDLLSCARRFVAAHFTEVCKGEEFLNMSVDEVASIISSDSLNVSAEEQVLEAMFLWVKHNEVERACHIEHLMKFIRVPLMSQSYLLERANREPLLSNCPFYKDLLIKTLVHRLKRHELSETEADVDSSLDVRPRVPVGTSKVLYVFGGQAPKAIRTVEAFDVGRSCWTFKSSMPERRCRCGVTVLDNLVFILGGFNGSQRVNDVDVYDTRSEIWGKGVSMLVNRSTLGVASFKKGIYAVGGFDGSQGLASVERYDLVSKEWKFVASMNTRRSSVGVAVLGDALYAVGGYNGADRICMNTVERYLPERDVWEPLASMSCARSGAAVAALNGLLYVVGGHEGLLVRRSVEFYDPDSNEWLLTSDLNVARRNAGIANMGGKLYVCGGDDGYANIDSVEVFEPHKLKWTLLEERLNTGRSYAGVAGVE